MGGDNSLFGCVTDACDVKNALKRNAEGSLNFDVETYLWDDVTSPQRMVSGVFGGTCRSAKVPGTYAERQQTTSPRMFRRVLPIQLFT
jgi:hypothetical protein